MEFIKLILAFILMAFFETEIIKLPPDSKEVMFLGFCMLLAGMIAHSDKS